jgi:hypothetical protein
MSDLQKFYDQAQSAAMKLAFEKAWASMSFQYEPETTTGSRVKEMLAAVILELAATGERDRVVLLRSIALGRRWLDQISRGTIASMEAIALREGCSSRHVERTIASAFLSPEIVKAAAEAGWLAFERQGAQRRSERVVAAVAGAWIKRRLRALVIRIRLGNVPQPTSQIFGTPHALTRSPIANLTSQLERLNMPSVDRTQPRVSHSSPRRFRGVWRGREW